MISLLRIKNLALVESLEVEFDRGLNIISGETGAGKSIILGALSLLLGERADRNLIRTDAETCSVEAVFDFSKSSTFFPLLQETLESLGLEKCEEDSLLLKRVFSITGSNKNFVNGAPATLQQLKSIGNLLVDIHGPHDHQSLFQKDYHLTLLDAFAGTETIRHQFASIVQECRDLLARQSNLVVDDKVFQQQMDLLKFQVQEIKAANLHEDEEASVENEFRIAQHSRNLVQSLTQAVNLLQESDESAITQLGQVEKLLQDSARIDTTLDPLLEQQKSLTSQLQDLAQELQHRLDKLEIDPERLTELEQRVTLFHSLKRKYGRTLAEVIQFGETAEAKLDEMQNREIHLAEIQKQYQKLVQRLKETGKKLTEKRLEAIPKMEKLLVKELRDLGFKDASLSVDISTNKSWPGSENFAAPPSNRGFDTVEILFAPNKGEALRPLRQIASSGELARVMLAIKAALADQDQVPVLIFDEVDANVGGQTASRVGEKMLGIGKRHQVFCITHLPQVAASGNHHFVVQKTTRSGRTYSEIQRLNADQRVEEVARMLGGKDSTTVTLQHARELLKTSR